MASVYSKNLQIFNAEQFKKSIDDVGAPYLYFTFGKVEPWSETDTPPQATTSVDDFNLVWKNMIGAKQLQGNDVRLGIRRNDWVSGQSYFAYDDCSCSMNMNDSSIKFYVVTDEWNVYKCISNNNNSISTAKPTGINTELLENTIDNYVWKYMYTLTDEEKLRFVTSEYIPVKTLTEDNGSLQWHVQQNAVAGSIESIKILDGGSGYTSVPDVTIVGDGTGANVSATLTGTSVSNLIISNKGSGYTSAEVIFSAPSTIGGTTATAKVIISPPGGHGSNPVEELGGSYIIMNPRLKGSESGIIDVNNEFRQIAIIKNPLLVGGTQLASNLVYSQATTLYLDSVGGNYIEDEIVYQGLDVASATFKGTVISWNSELNILKLTNVSGNPTSGPVTGDTSKTSRIYQDSDGKAFEPYTGSLLYLNNIAPIQRAEDQTEDFKIVFSF